MTSARSKWFAVGVSVLAAASGTARAQDKAPILSRAEQCLRQKVDRVVADEPDIGAAANFLVSYACAEETAGAMRYVRNAAYVQMFGALGKTLTSTTGANAGAKPPGASPPTNGPAATGTAAAGAATAAAAAGALFGQLRVDPETGELISPAGPGGPSKAFSDMLAQMNSYFGQYMPDATPVALRKLAGELVLQARERRRAK